MNSNVFLLTVKVQMFALRKSYLFFFLKRITFRKMFNLLRLILSYELSILFRKKIHWGYPAFLSIEPTNICNLKCPECPTGGNFSSVKKGYIDQSTVQMLQSSISESIIHVNLFFQGEPFLHRDLALVAEQISSKCFVTISTNGHFLDLKTCEKIILSGIFKIIVSLDGINQEQYEQYRKGGNFETVIQGIKNLSETKRRLKMKFPIVEIQCLLFNYTEDSKNEMKVLSKQLDADKLIFKTAQFYNEENAKKMLPSQKNSRYISEENGNLKIKKTLKNKCWKMWSGAVVTWNGDVVPCCYDKDKKFVQGNIQITQLNHIWKHLKYDEFRCLILKKRSNIEMCKNCTE